MKTNIQHFALFKRECHRWVGALGLRDWEIFYLHDDEGVGRASIEVDLPEQHIARIYLTKNWSHVKPIDNKDIKKVAFHEVAELFLWSIRIKLEAYYSKIVVDDEIHKLIRTLENVML